MTKYSLITLIFSLLLGVCSPGMAAEASLDESAAGGPYIPPAQHRFSEEQGCVEPTEDMRRNHMEYLLHQRDETMHQGIRTEKHSLDECIECHVSDAPDAPRVSSEQHFCNSCHTYAAVTIDCFQCHADRPVEARFDALKHSSGYPIKAEAQPATLTPEQLNVPANEDMGHE